MKKLLRTGATVAALLAGRAVAADLGVPIHAVPEPPPAWSGFYAGVNAGATWSTRNSVTVTTLPTSTFGGGAPILITDAGPAAASATAVLALDHRVSFIGGAQVGYNWQISAIVVGFETDIQGLVGSNPAVAGAVFVGPVSGSTATPYVTTFNASKQLDYLGTLRGRLGYLVSPAVLAYGTGGLAYGGVSGSVGLTTSNAGYPAIGLAPSWGTTNVFSDTRAGWTIGGGLEVICTASLRLKLEYLYYNLGTVTAAVGGSGPVFLTGFPGAGSAWFTNGSAVSSRYSGNIIRLGLNYNFNGFSAFPRF
jgi:outer membrane immunogenic protein